MTVTPFVGHAAHVVAAVSFSSLVVWQHFVYMSTAVVVVAVAKAGADKGHSQHWLVGGWS